MFYWLSEKLEKCDLIVVFFWNKVELSWKPSDRLKTRPNKLLKLYKNGSNNKILVSWWLWKEWFKEWSVMKDYLEKLWFKKNDIIVDNEWNNTYKTVLNTKKILEENNLKSIIIVSHYYHIMRTRMAFQKAWFSEIYYTSADLELELRDFILYTKRNAWILCILV